MCAKANPYSNSGTNSYNSIINNLDGVGTVAGGSFANAIKVQGVYTFTGSVQSTGMQVSGVTTIEGDLVTQPFECSGVTTIKGNLKATSINVSGVVSVGGNKIEADHISCDGVLRVKGQVSADTVDAEGFINAQEIVGDSISIHSYRKSFFFQLFMKVKEAFSGGDFSEVDLIEATTVYLRGVRAKQVNGHNVRIGPNCQIDVLDCSGTLVLDASAQVGSLTGNYSMA